MDGDVGECWVFERAILQPCKNKDQNNLHAAKAYDACLMTSSKEE